MSQWVTDKVTYRAVLGQLKIALGQHIELATLHLHEWVSDKWAGIYLRKDNPGYNLPFSIQSRYIAQPKSTNYFSYNLWRKRCKNSALLSQFLVVTEETVCFHRLLVFLWQKWSQYFHVIYVFLRQPINIIFIFTSRRNTLREFSSAMNVTTQTLAMKLLRCTLA